MADWPNVAPERVLFQISCSSPGTRLADAVVGAAAALSLHAKDCLAGYVHAIGSAAPDIGVLAALESGELGQIDDHSCANAGAEVPDTPWRDALHNFAVGVFALWDARASDALGALEQAAAGASACGYEDVALRSMDAVTACHILLGHSSRARGTAQQAMSLWLSSNKTSTRPVISLAYLNALPAMPPGRPVDPSLSDADPYSAAFAAYMRGEKAHESGDNVGRRLAWVEARSYLHPRGAGRLLAGLLSDMPGEQQTTRAASLTNREVVILRALAGPLTLAEIARELSLSRNTVKSQVRSVYKKLNVHDRREAALLHRRVVQS